MQMGFYFDQTRCNGCYTCIVACKDKNDVPAGPASWRRVFTIEKGVFPDLFVAFLSTACHHCVNPSCVASCPHDAILKRSEDGVVVVDQEACVGRDECEICLEECDYDAPQFDDVGESKMQKCDFCLDRISQGRKPVCIDACPMRALDAGPIEELKAKYGNLVEAEGFVNSEEMKPCIIFKPKKDEQERTPLNMEVAPGPYT